MSVTGTIALLMYFVTEALFGAYIKIKWKRILLGMTICFYTIPFANYKYRIMELVEFGCRRNVFRRHPVNGELDTEFAISYIGQKIVLGDGQKLLVGLTVACGIIALGILCYKLYVYMSLKKIMTTYERCIVPEKCTLCFQQVKQELHVKRNVNLCCVREISSPVTTGVWKITIWLPFDVERYKECELRMILMHELGHICHWDQMFYCMGLVVVALHWFNPASYFLLIAIRLVNEQYSDEMVTSHMTAPDRTQYCKLMIREIEKTVSQPSMGIGFIGVKKITKRRITYIMKNKKKCAMIAAVAGIIGSMMNMGVVYAYEPPQITQNVSTGMDVDGVTNEFFYEGERLDTTEIYSDDFFTDSDGQVYMISDVQQYATCKNHSYVTGTSTQHRLDGKGGCVVNYYHAKRCTKCGMVEKGELYRSVVNKVCPH